MMPLTEREIRTIRHEADHAAALYVLFGPDAVGTITRVPSKMHRGQTRLADLPPFRHPALNASDLAVALLVPLLDGCDGCDDDVKKAYECAEVAYRYRPAATTSAEDWADAWVHGTVADRARELLDSSRFAEVRRVLERALDSCPTLDPRTVLDGR